MQKAIKTFDEIATGVKKKKEVAPFDSLEDCFVAYTQKIEEKLANVDFDDMMCNKQQWIEQNIIPRLSYTRYIKKRQLVSEEILTDCLDFLKKITEMINKRTVYSPSVLTFCIMVGISSDSLSQWYCENNARGEAVRIIFDYFRGLLTQGLQSGEYDAKSAGFIGKATLGMKETDGTQTNINIIAPEMSVQDILKEYEKNKKLS